jgi:hypothetical protein
MTRWLLDAAAAAEAAAGAVVLVLALVAYHRVGRFDLAAAAAVTAGAGFVVRGAIVAVRLTPLSLATADGGGMVAAFGIDVLAGAGGTALGVLASGADDPRVLLPAALCLFGSALLVGSAVSRQIDVVLRGRRYLVVELDFGIEVLAGMAALTLGALALMGIADLHVILAGLMAVGAGMLAASLPALTPLAAAPPRFDRGSTRPPGPAPERR